MAQLCASHACRVGGERKHAAKLAERGPQLCRSCYDKMQTNLAELPRLYAECESVLSRFPFALEQKVHRGGVVSPSFSEAAVEARSDIMSLLASWSGMVADARGMSKPPPRDVRHLAVFLARHLAWLAAHSAGPDFADEVARIAATARRASMPSGLRVALGQCVEDGCGGSLFALAGGPEAAVRCEAGHAWRAHEWLRLARKVDLRGGEPR
jgi:hypothetical protein